MFGQIFSDERLNVGKITKPLKGEDRNYILVCVT